MSADRVSRSLATAGLCSADGATAEARRRAGSESSVQSSAKERVFVSTCEDLLLPLDIPGGREI